MLTNTLHWGIIGCGHIAHTFMTSNAAVKHSEVVACAARDWGRAQTFAEHYSIPKASGDYTDLINNPNVHAIYVATTHNTHYSVVAECIKAGKAVLCEKPLTVNAKQTENLFALAKQHNILLVEAVWMRFLPAIHALAEHIRQGIIGEVCAIHANFSFNGEFAPSHRLQNPNTAGGALLDLGIYPLHFADLIYATLPDKITSQVRFSETGVDASNYIVAEYGAKRHAILSSSFVNHTPTHATITGSNGIIEVPNFLAAQSYQTAIGEHQQTFSKPFVEQQNFTAEIAEFKQCLESGRTECPSVPSASTIRVMRTMDTLRAQWGLRYSNTIETTEL
ncbi:Gfo/Idh/MocA family protein [Alteromonas flava]|uniref:Gfo/Idh/MocA family protein n=1 Tax=Alteromonas flava TaxID=2048003 RepID=UPI000C28463D|nr:Gfo/Idh/MocA family oxidoreductase [Alteromonas flava]